MSKKRNKKPKARSSNRVADSSRRSGETIWSDLEQAFFASAPPDVAEPLPEPERFDDLVAATPLRSGAGRFAAWPTAQSLGRQSVAIALASVLMLIGLSAVLFASLT
jgi:hypothetical protein